MAFECAKNVATLADPPTRFVESGQFDEAVANCPAYSGAELRACLDYLDRYDASDSTKQPAKFITIDPRTSIHAVRAVC